MQVFIKDLFIKHYALSCWVCKKWIIHNFYPQELYKLVKKLNIGKIFNVGLTVKVLRQ